MNLEYETIEISGDSFFNTWDNWFSYETLQR